jgi:ABC-type glycerol-3-phosphate transport system substrate-binding protein
MTIRIAAAFTAALLVGSALARAETTVTIATVNNGDMIRMQGLSEAFEKANPDIKLDWVVLEENVLRQRVTTDIATKGGQFDVLTIGTYEVPIWAKRGWLMALDNLPEDYDVDDILPPIREALSYDGTMYAAPFYGESSFTMYRTDLFEKAGLEMPEKPTWDFIKDAARKLADKSNEVYGICLRGKPGWGENMAFLTAMANSYGARWFDMEWKPQFDGEAWKATITDYVELMQEVGPPDASANGYNETWPCSDQASARFGSTRPRPASSSPTRTPMWPTVSASHSRRTRVWARARIGSGPGRWRFPRVPKTRMGRRDSWLGPPRSSTWNWSPRRTAGPTYRRAPAPRSMKTKPISTWRPSPS